MFWRSFVDDSYLASSGKQSLKPARRERVRSGCPNQEGHPDQEGVAAATKLALFFHHVVHSAQDLRIFRVLQPYPAIRARLSTRRTVLAAAKSQGTASFTCSRSLPWPSSAHTTAQLLPESGMPGPP